LTNENREIELLPYSGNAESDFSPIKFCTLANARFLQDKHLSGCIGAFPADNFVFDAGVTYFMAISDEKIPDSSDCKSLFFRSSQVRLNILVDLQPDEVSENARGLSDLSIFGNYLLG
jgi:hypothetical protein